MNRQFSTGKGETEACWSMLGKIENKILTTIFITANQSGLNKGICGKIYEIKYVCHKCLQWPNLLKGCPLGSVLEKG